MSNKKKRMYEVNCHFQDPWATKLFWVEYVVGVDGKITQVKCKMCTIIEGGKKLLVPKLDLLWKHVGQRKATIASACVVVGEFYF